MSGLMTKNETKKEKIAAEGKTFRNWDKKRQINNSKHE